MMVSADGPLLPAERGFGCRPAGDNWRYLEGMVWIGLIGRAVAALARRVRYVEQCLSALTSLGSDGVLEAMRETLAAVVERDTTADMIDSTVVRAHHCAVGQKRDPETEGAWPFARRLYNQVARPL
jgi:hypothetical protein